MADIDMEIKEPLETGADDFHKEETPNIWALSNGEEDNNNVGSDKDGDTDAEELDKPSFLRRHLKLGGNKPKTENPKDDKQKKDDDADDKVGEVDEKK
jgi:hypothetical protein